MKTHAADTAFVPGRRFDLGPSAEGPLSGFTFAVKDLIDLEGMKTGAGNPDWLAASPPAHANAPAVDLLLAAGARCIGKTITDELAFSLEGRNAHYGTPINPAHPDCLPGGSSSGSAVAVAAGACDFALGTDTGGSVRVPGAFCDLYAMRPSHSAIDMTGVTPFAPSYDTIGWFARDRDVLAQVGDVLLPPSESGAIEEVVIFEDLFELCDADLGAALWVQAERIANGLAIPFVEGDWREGHHAYARLQARDIRQSLGPELERLQPKFAPDMAERFEGALSDTAPCTAEETVRQSWTKALLDALPPGHAALIPTSPVRNLPRISDGSELGSFYERALAICAIAGHAGAPQIQIPTDDGGLSFIARPGSDRALLQFVAGLKYP